MATNLVENPTGKCIGHTLGEGCPDSSMAEPSSYVSAGIAEMRYHCAKCFDIYRRRYEDNR